jgi:hypothetical protein
MADLKISALTASTTPLAGTEVLPIVQSSTTKQVSVANLTAGRAVSALSIDAGNLQLSGNTFATTNTNGNFTIQPNGTGYINYYGVDKTNGNEVGQLTLRSTDSYAIDKGGSIAFWGKYNSGGDYAAFARIYGAKETSADGAFTGYFAVATSPGGTPTERFKVGSSGDVTVSTGNLVIGTSGKGIDFSATSGSGTSELLADYEEGTFTPTIAGQSTAGTGTYTTQVGTYTKIGRVVYVSVNLAWSAHTGTGDMQVNGLPFTVNSTTQSQMSNGTYDLALTALNMLLARAQTSGTFIKLLQSPVGGGAWNGVPMDTSVTVLEITGFYTV